ncbi:MAG: hypothetical protein A3B89_02905 [Candidatus Buchananbacteria bacterium RIFCSPHIGHO2_02_FULL_40_13]|uniref:Uncharacterized protein n=1 Tax=Candidatus Buchananbacteria bacterium RIFCSPLOWO2_01_FULL_39_33 TaxID=1797543 RepID=A0A1G1YI25_9BACT|nr:MAG: hypothetical protein A2820_02085 [Candidatus Buchananbacteria bacterium RIFCSPHIGHO2_01_FULL_40_35]OGY49947.1 MAG: hypothetical protein A3B89_02905 [Candidatus Buchananbacteria bacterium RIFCSPHIGHO2_02_FULL_40_13]OGY51911.1 MAG: hypothetical protein A3A02_01175 [Candidatus Buchananbacteria bacterium RIFCSPLOWO2_01_FULL_39_33]
MKKITKRQIVWAVVIALILIISLARQFTNEVQWIETVAYIIILLVAGGAYELAIWLRTQNRMYRIAFRVGLVGALFLGWVSGAVGIIGSENNPANLMYWAVPTVLLIGSLAARFRPRGMAYTLLTVALVQVLIPVVALFIWPAQTSWGEAGVIGVLILNSLLAMFFFVSAWLFRHVSLS